jgi:fibronectin-binding autotransporter adhesin
MRGIWFGRQQRGALAVSAAAAVAVMSAFVTPGKAATVTWTGATPDPNSASYTSSVLNTAPFLAPFYVNGQNVYQWNTTVSNWSGAATYSVGDNAIFSDNPTNNSGTTTFIALPSSNMNPTSMTFSHDPSGSANTRYVFLRTGDLMNPANVTSNTPFGNGNTAATLTLDTGFLGTVILRARINSTALNGNTIIRSGTLEVHETQDVPGGATGQTCNVTLAGGTLSINVQTAGNTQPGSADYNGTLSVIADSTLALSRDTTGSVSSSRTWQGPITVNSGVTLTLQELNGVRFRLPGNLNSSTGTFKLVDGSTPTEVTLENTTGGAGSSTAIFDLGAGASILDTNFTSSTTTNLGALIGGAATSLKGSISSNANVVDTYAIGGKGTNTTFDGGITNGTGAVPHTTAITKVGAGTLLLTGSSANTYTGTTTASGGTLIIGGTGALPSSAVISTTPGGTFLLDNTTSSNDRIGDTATISTNGGNFQFQGNLNAGTAEVTGQLLINALQSNVQALSTGTLGSPASITFASLGRNAGSTVNFDLVSNVDLKFASPPTLNDGIIGGYATANTNNWATLSGSAVTQFGAYTTAGNASDPNTWTGTDNIDQTATGALTVTSPVTINSLKLSGTGANLTIGAGGSLNIDTGGILATGTATIAGPGTLSAGPAASASELITHVQSGGGTLTIGASIANNAGGTVTVVKSGPGTLVLSGTASSYTGGVKILNGSVVAGATNAVLGDLTIDNGTTFNLAGFSQTVGAVNLINGSAINSGGAATLTGNAYNVRLGTISASLAGTAALTKTTGGLVTLSGSNSYSGGTSVTGGTLAAGANNSIGNGTVSVTSGATLDIGAFNQTVGAVTLGNGTTSGGNILGTTGTLTGTSFDAQNGTITANLSGVGATLTKSNTAATITLTGLSTYTGATTVNGGTVTFNSIANAGVASALGAPTTPDAANLILNGGTLNYNGTGSTSNRLFTVAGSTTLSSSGTGALNLTNTDPLGVGGSTLTLAGSNAGANTLAAMIGGGTNITKSGGGTWILAPATGSTYTGVTTISQGILQVGSLANGGSPSPIGASTNAEGNLILSGGTLKYTGSGDTTDRLFRLAAASTIDASGSGPINFNNTGAEGQAQGLTLTGTNTGANTIAGAFSGTTTITKTGSGTWLLTGALTYTGTTTAATSVSAGKLTLATNQTTGLAVAATSTGLLELAAGGGSNRVIRTQNLTVSGSGKVNLQDNKLIVTAAGATGSWTGSNYTGVTGLIASGRGTSNLWNGSVGIITTQSAAVGSNFTSIGVARASAVLPATATATALWAGQTITGTDTLVMYTYGGDATLDGKINVDDYIKIDSGIAAGLTGWSNGDFNYDGKINVDDYTLFIDANIGTQGPQFPTAGGMGGSGASGVSAVPEPVSLSILGLGAAAMLGRRRRVRW